MNKETWVVEEEAVSGVRLDVYLASRFDTWSRTRLQKLIEDQLVWVDGKPAFSNKLKLTSGQTIQITWPEDKIPRLQKSNMPLPPVLFEDSSLIVLNKPAGMVVHPAAGHFDGNTLVEIVAPRLLKGPWPEDIRRGLVHRLDRDTSGAIIFAKTPEMQTKISKQFSLRQVKKTYLALVSGKMESKEGTLECRIARHPGKRQRFAVSSDGRWAFTKFDLKESFGKWAALVELRPLTGRTHQLRVQMAAIKHPILGDHIYGEKNNPFSFIHRQMLHAFHIEFKHPKTDKMMSLSAPLPEDFQDALKLIRLNPC